MKKMNFRKSCVWTLVIIGVFFLASCYWNPQNGAGKITLALSSGSRTQINPTLIQYARVYLYADSMNSQINIGDGTPYVETTMTSSGGSVTVNQVPAGDGYQMVLTLGSKPDGSTFVPGQFGTSESFNVTAGHRTDVSIGTVQTVAQAITATFGTTGQAPTDASLLGKNLNSVTFSGTFLAASDGRHVYFGDVTSGIPTTYLTFSAPAGANINSVSSADIGGNSVEAWANTNQGVLEIYPSTQTLIQTLPANPPQGNTILSGAYPYGSGAYGVYFVGDRGLEGVDTTSQNWVDIPLSSSGSSFPVLDIAFPSSSLSYPYAYFATGFGVFGIDNKLLIPGDNNLSYIKGNAGFLRVYHNGSSLYVSSLSIYYDANGPNSLIVGTDDGIYVEPLTSLNPNIGQGTTDTITSSPLPGTSGFSFRKVDIGGYAGTPNYWAGLCNDVIVLGATGSLSTLVLPVAAVTLGDLKSIRIYAYGSYIYIAIAGTEGLTVVPLGAGG